MGRAISVEGPARLGQYLLLEQLSDSFFGARWRVRSANTESLRAVRVVSQEAPERIASAAAAVRGIEHPSLLPPLELVRRPQVLGIVTEHVEGETLRSLLQHAVQIGESIPQAVAVRIALDLLEALQALAGAEHLHPGTYLHGGLTLDSVHVGADGRTRLLDAGVAGAAARAPNLARHPVRTAYSAPEHADDNIDFDVRSDVFSVGVLLWETLACRSLFGDPSYEVVRDRLLHARIQRVQRDRFLRGEPIAAALAGVVDRALQRDREQRFESFEALADALRGASNAAEREEVARFVSGAPAAPAPESVPPVAESLPDLQVSILEPDESDAYEPATPLEDADLLDIASEDAAPLDIASEDAAPLDIASEDHEASEALRLSDLEAIRPRRALGVIPLLVALAVIAILSFVAFQPAAEPEPDAGRTGLEPRDPQNSRLSAPNAMHATSPARPAAAPAQPTSVDSPAGVPPTGVAQPAVSGAVPEPKTPDRAHRSTPRPGRASAFVPNDI